MTEERYTRPEMEQTWSERRKFETWLAVEIAVLKAKEKLALIPRGVAEKTGREGSFKVEEIKKRENITRHDMVAFLEVVSESLSPEIRSFLHTGLTSYDIEDTALAVQLKGATNLIERELIDLLQVLRRMAQEHKYAIQIGRTHGVHAEPITFGLKLLNWYDEIERHLSKLKANRQNFLVGKISGAVGTYANIDPRLEEIVCFDLGISPAKISTQIVSRDKHSLYVYLLASIASSLEKFATEIRNLHRTEIREVQELSRAGQRGSSAMPHKKALPNPVSAENISSLPRIIRGYMTAALENQTYCWHERTLDNSAAERILFKDASTYTHYLLWRFGQLLKNLKVYPDKMRENLNLTKGIIFSEDVMITLAAKGMGREDAHTLLQEKSSEALDKGLTFKDVLMGDSRITGLLSESEIDACLTPERHLKNIDQIFARFGI